MGGLFSVPRTQRILIGDLSSLPDREQKLYELSKYVLDLENHYIGTLSNKLGIKIVALEVKSLDKSDDQSKEEPATLNDCKDISCTGIDLQTADDQPTDEVISLFHLLVTDKPYFYSQTFSAWRSLIKFRNLCSFSCFQPEKRTIYIQPVDNFPNFIADCEMHMKSFGSSFDFFALLKTFTEIYFDGLSVNLLPNIFLMQSKWNIKSRLHHKTGQKQYFVRDFYETLQKVMPSDGFCIMGISWTDLYPTEDLNFVLGEANFMTNSGIFCFGRYEPKAFNPDTHKDITELDGKILWRILKVLSHETCHLFGLQHCWYFQCAMNESTSMLEAASQPLFLCPVCLRKLQYSCGFDVLSRYKKMLPFLRDISKIYPTSEFLHSVIWLEKCIEFLQSDVV
ncbi:archaemetzincin-2-like isoform X1 [Mercenaria mercenaria]|uniref:archaemetzincin-2-like isoform X1 n=1 Tax=Mercenaria mercenaria TaxID=6596 RepID=UPI00234E388F|nr:archaemetzincin-2-like isoform X1 [Mercenaria mercenaria]XP_053385166.1 archaemetzincin-2-like isoform X1 [Mercenaria mercenaria]